MKLTTKLLYMITCILILFISWLIITGLSSFNPNLPEWKKQFKEMNPATFTGEQHAYYKLFTMIVTKDAGYKTKKEVDVMATSLVAFSTNIPYFAGVMYTESLLPSVWKNGKRIKKHKHWHHFTQKNDGGSKSYGAPKIKYRSIKEVCALIGEKPPLYYKIDVTKIEWQIKLMRWAAIYFDHLVKTGGSRIKALAIYKYGPEGYRLYKKKNPYKEPFDVSGKALCKATEYLTEFAGYMIKGEIVFHGAKEDINNKN